MCGKGLEAATFGSLTTSAPHWYVHYKMARPKRFELLTPRFVVWCSIQLSYGRASGRVRHKPRDPVETPAAMWSVP